MKEMKRIISMVLCLVMVLSLLPTGAVRVNAAETVETGNVVDAMVVMSDVHINTNSNQTKTKKQLVQNVMNAIKADFPNVSTVNSAGDMFSSNEGTMSGNASTVTDWVDDVFNVPVHYVWSDHDRAATDISKESRFVYGNAAGQNYYVYLLSMADLSSWDRYNAGFYSASEIAQHIEAFKTTAAGLDKSKPLFIVGHQPLMDDRGDNGYAYDWVTAINEVAATMDVAYFYGHNHKYDDNQKSYYYAKGETMPVPTTKVLSGSGYSTDLESKNVKLNFTHINAGYMNPETTSSSTQTNARLGTALAVVISENAIRYVTYNKNGKYTSSFAVDETVNRDHKLTAISVTAPEKVNYVQGETFDATGLTVTATYGSTRQVEVTEGYTVSEVDMNQVGEQTVTVTYQDKTATFTINVAEDPNATPTLVSIAITKRPTKLTYKVDEMLDTDGMEVTATYSDGKTAVITEDEWSVDNNVDMTTPGTKEVGVCCSMNENTVWAYFDITVVADEEPKVEEKTFISEDTFAAVTATATGATLAYVQENAKADELLEYYWRGYDISLEGQAADTSVTVKLWLDPDAMTSENVAVYHVNENGELEAVTGYAVAKDDDNVEYITISNAALGTYIYGTPKVIQSEGAKLVSLKLTPPTKTAYFDSDVKDKPVKVIAENGEQEETVEKVIYLDITGLEVIAVYDDGTEKEIQWNQFDESADGFALTFDALVVDGQVQYGKKTITVTYVDGNETATATFSVNVCRESITVEEVTIKFDTPGVEDLTVETLETVDEVITKAVAEVITGDVTVYDIKPVYADGFDKLQGTATVTLPLPEGLTNPVVYYVSDDGATIENMNAQVVDGKIVFTTAHFSKYVVGENTEIEVPDPDTADGENTTTTTTKKTVYVLASIISSGNEYLIVNGNSAGSRYALANNSGSVAATGVTVKTDSEIGTYIELDDATDELWTVSNSYRFQNNGYYLRYDRGLGLSTNNYTTWSYSNNRLSYRSGNTTRYLRYNNDWTTTQQSNSATSIYFYVPTEIEVETTTTVSGTYSIAGTDETVAAIKDSTFDLTSTLTFTPESGEVTTTVDPEGVTYEVYEGGDPLGVISGISGNTVTLSGKVGKALVKVSYTTEYGIVTDYITVTATTPDHYSIQLHEVELTVATGVTADNFASNTYYTYDSKTGFYSVATAYVEGTTYYTLPVIQGDAITAPIALKGIEAGDAYSVWAVVKAYASAEDTEGVDVGTLGDALSWTVSDESIATINTETGVITFTGTNYGTFDVTVAFNGADGKTITDTITISATESLYTVPGDGTNDFPEYPNQGAVRFDKTATAVGNYSETGIAKVELSMTGVPYTSGNRLDVVLMLDRSSSMYKDGVQHRISSTVEATKAFIKNIVMNEDGTFNNNRILVLDFLGGNLDSSEGGGANHKFQSNQYTTNEESGYQIISSQAELDALLTKIETDFKGQTSLYGTEYAQGLELCYNALKNSKGDGNQQFCVFMSDGIPNYMMGETTHFKKTDNIVKMFDVTNRTTANGTATRNATKYEYEHYSTQMKNEGVTVFTVGLGLKNTNSAWSNTSKEVCEQVANMLLNDISGPAKETAAQRDTGNAVTKRDKYFFSVADDNAAADMKNVFSAISQKIVEAARDVKVEDKIGNNYTLNFSIPGYGTDNAVSADALDGLTEFYIQAVEYQLNADKERTGDPTVLENFTFNADGSFKSHTVNGTACEKCSHVTVTNGTVTKIEGTYFNYESKADGEYLHWEADKLTTTELALQYFAYLDNSTGVDAEDQIPAGTYYTNEYATLTYTNYNGNQVQQEFPKPQMTWNGAQVSYVFYLVNEAGQPVNRAGRVVPFAEAVYVTDVFTYSVIWNDLEQSAGLEAKYLAEKLVSDVYALYDDDASYNIHVYEDEKEVNLNNHFVIGGDVSDSYNTTEHSWTNAKTTYVFNNKSDSTKYNTVGAYIANDGKDNTTSNAYYCKSAAIEGATYTTSVDAAGVTVYTVTGLGNGYQSISGETQVQYNVLPSKTGATEISGYAYYVDENGAVYTIVQKTNGTEVEKGFDFHNTTVAFAVVWKPELVEDTVVIDYGLDVVIDVIRNDNMAAGVVGVRTDKPDADINSGTYTAAKATAVDVYIDSNNDRDNLKENKIGTATVENLNQVRFSLDKDNGMQFTDPAVFYYEADVNFYDSNNVLQTTSMYSKVTVIPATTVYYEDEYVDLFTHTAKYDQITYDGSNPGVYYILNDDGTYTRATQLVAGTTYYKANGYDVVSGWDTNSVAANVTQAQDRPGESKISETLDADNVYGYDAAYDNMSTYSMGNAAKMNVNNGKYASAEFTFYGTGFDVISLTSNTTGVVFAKVYNENNEQVRYIMVDTYYGYTYDDVNDEWKPTNSADSNAIYQVPVITVEGLEYGKYKAVLTASYNANSDHNANEPGYDFYLDAIRIYDPIAPDEVVDNKGTEETTDDVTVGDIYEKDGEADPEYYEVRNIIINASMVYTKVEIEAFEEGETYYTKNADAYIAVDGEYVAGTDYFVLNDQIVDGAVFIDGKGETFSIADYISFGPNNEVYLANGQSIAFTLNAPEKDGYKTKVQIGWKSTDGTVKLSYVDKNKDVKTDTEQEIATATDMYYDITDLNGKTIQITNTGSGIISITNVKFSYEKVNASSGGSSSSGSESAVAEETVSPFTIRMEDIEVILAYLRGDMEEEIVPELPEVTKPETEPEVTEPEATEPETEPSKPSKPGNNKPNNKPGKEEKVDSAELKAAVEEAKKLKEKDYTKESYKALKSALKEAEKVLKDKKATQAKVDEALAALNEAVDALETNTPATKPGKEEKPNQNKPGKEETPEKETKPAKEDKPAKAENNNQNKPANNKGPAAAAEQVQKVAEAVGKIAEALFGWLFR